MSDRRTRPGRRSQRGRSPVTAVATATVARVVAVAVVALATTACTNLTGDDADDATGDATAIEIPVPSVTVPPSRLTPFCQGMIALAERLDTDPPDDVEALILDTYLDLVDDVPPEIEADFLAVVADLQGEPGPTGEPGPSATTSDTATGDPATAGDPSNLDEEGRTPPDDPSQRLNAYVDATCRGVDNNPGPPPTEPRSGSVPDGG